jgi:Uma2 family endonuclease
MTDVNEIQSAIEKLTSSERASIASWLREVWGETGYHVAEAAIPYRTLPEPRQMSVQEYFAFEKKSGIRCEYVGGRIFAMSGASPRHNKISGNLYRAISDGLAGKPCQTFINDVKLRLEFNRDEIFYYPDLMVVCGKVDMEAPYVSDPKLLIEVLSPSTESTDRREKAFHYQRIGSLEEYVLVEQHEREMTIHRRAEGWKARILRGMEAAAELRSIAVSVPMARVYEGVF